MQKIKQENGKLLERCNRCENELDKFQNQLDCVNRNLEEKYQVVEELEKQNKQIQTQLDQFKKRQRRIWLEDCLVNKCMNDRCQKVFTTVVRKVFN